MSHAGHMLPPFPPLPRTAAMPCGLPERQRGRQGCHIRRYQILGLFAHPLSCGARHEHQFACYP